MSTRAVLMSILLSLAAGAAGAADGLVAPDGRDLWPQWQARITVSTTALAPVSLTDPALAPRASPRLGAVLGDYYFDVPGLRLPASLGGLRATGGLMTSTHGLSFGPAVGWRDGSGSEAAAAYVGLGYTGRAAKGGWGITADLGLAAESSTHHSSSPLLGVQGFDNASRDLRLSPVLQLGVHYAF